MPSELTTSPNLRMRMLSAVIALGGLLAGSLAIAQERQFTEPAEIDRAVTAFTGVQVGLPGGARQNADSRLRLNACGRELQTSWHGTRGRTVRVACEGAGGWQIFVALTPAPQTASAQAKTIVRRGDRITVQVDGRGFSVQRPGEARESGAAGDWISVRFDRGGDFVSAMIVRPGLAIIPQ
ncbi:flagella basal body P-ring formation protein FlgA [Erythrobacter sp. HA6-11]